MKYEACGCNSNDAKHTMELKYNLHIIHEQLFTQIALSM